jgi:hypothetical protein
LFSRLARGGGKPGVFTMGFVPYLDFDKLTPDEKKSLRDLLKRERDQLRDALALTEKGLAKLGKAAKAKKAKKKKKKSR